MFTRASAAAFVLLIGLGAAVAVGIGLALRTLFDVVPLWGFAVLGVVEASAAGSAVLDWRDAKLEIATKRRALLVGHVTLVQRLARRARWHATTLRLIVPARAQRGAATPAVRGATVAEHVDEQAAA